MAKLPYTFTVCPPGPEPERFTATCTQAGKLMQHTPDLTIQNNKTRWQSWDKPMQSKPFEDKLRDLLERRK